MFRDSENTFKVKTLSAMKSDSKCSTILVLRRNQVCRYYSDDASRLLSLQRSQTPAVAAWGCLKLSIPLVSQLVETWKHPAALLPFCQEPQYNPLEVDIRHNLSGCTLIIAHTSTRATFEIIPSVHKLRVRRKSQCSCPFRALLVYNQLM
jgi:hypothetical protein